RDLQQAASLGNGNLRTALSEFSATTSRDGQLARLDGVLAAWALTASNPSVATRVAGIAGSSGESYTLNWQRVGTVSRPSSGSMDAWNALVAGIAQKIEILESFNGRSFFDFE